MRPTALISCFLVYVTLAAAWPWPKSWVQFDDIKRELAPVLSIRQDNKNDNGGSSSGPAKTSKGDASSSGDSKNTQSASATKSGDDSKSTSDSKSTGKETGKDGETTSKYQTTKTYDARLPAGGLSMITPDIMSGSQYYKISDYVTFAWNYTSLKNTPTAIDILASCSLNSATYTIAMNQSVEATQSITWDTGKYSTSPGATPLVVATYTLVVYDADSDVSATAKAGYLGVYDQFTFGMYTKQPYTPIADYVCATCNGAMSSMQRQTLGFMLGMTAITVLSFGWFAGVAGFW